MPIKINGSTSGSTTITAPATGTDETIELSTALAAKAAISQLKIRQVVFADYGTTVTVNTTTPTDTGLSATITPTSASNKILVIAFQQFACSRSGNDIGHAMRLMRGASVAYTPDQNNYSSSYLYAVGATTTHLYGRAPLMYLDSPATTSATTYKIQGYTVTASYTVQFQIATSTSQMLLLEVAP